MPQYLSEEKSEVSRRMIAMEVFKTTSDFGSMVVQVCMMDADQTAREFSRLVSATGGRVQLVEDVRIRAVYQNGERVRQSDMREHYDMSDEEYAESKLLCSKQHEYF